VEARPETINKGIGSQQARRDRAGQEIAIMIVAMQATATDEQIQTVVERMVEIGFNVHRTTGTVQTILAGVGTPGLFDHKDFELFAGVAEVIRISSPYKLAGRSFRPEGTIVRFANGVEVGGDEVVVMAGPCSVESREQIFTAAAQVKAAGAKFLRGGAFKPRSSPYSFQGMGLEGLKLLREAGDATGLLIISEVMEISQIDLMLPYIDCFQIGARNMQNFNLLREVGLARKPALLKRGIAATIEELLLSAEYILSGGNYDVMLCERGIRTYETYTRNTMDISAIPVLKHLSHLPVLGDPSHGTGRRNMVPAMARATVAAGGDGLLIEVHPNPDKAVSDGAQSLFPDQFAKLMDELRIIAPAVGRTVATAAGESKPQPAVVAVS
jgi:3-deoxy-7-phosphoheptulonate synthase